MSQLLDTVYQSEILEAVLTDKYLVITLVDDRIIYVPKIWLQFLDGTQADTDFIAHGGDVWWETHEDGISLETILLGLPAHQYVTIEEMARMHDMDVHTIRRILYVDEKKSKDKQRIPGAIKSGSEQRGLWLIPKNVAKAFQKSNAGRKKSPNFS